MTSRKASAKQVAGRSKEARAKEAIVFAVGDRVTHRQFGDGKVNAVDGDVLTVEFIGSISRLIYNDYIGRRK